MGVVMKRFVATNFALLLVSFAFVGTSHAGSPLGGPGFGPARLLIVTPAIQATGWARNTLMDPVEYAHTKATDIRLRPNRFLHFYGNTVRFFYYSRLARQGCHPCMMLHAGTPVEGSASVETIEEATEVHESPEVLHEESTHQGEVLETEEELEVVSNAVIEPVFEDGSVEIVSVSSESNEQ